MSGQVVGSQCGVCQSKRRADAESFVHQGMSLAQAARAVDVDRQALARHMKNHAAPSADELAPLPEVEGPADSVLDAIGGQLERMLAGRLSQTQRLQVLAEQRRLAVDRARIVGPPPSREVRVNDIEGLGSLFGEMYKALQDEPSAREKLRDLWRARNVEVKT